MLRFSSLLIIALAVAGPVCAAPAAADSLTFIKNHNVWLANPDGSGQYQVTLDGTAGAPYESPSQANDGTIVAIREAPGQRTQIYRMTQSGRPAERPDQHAGAGHGRAQREGLAQRRARCLLVRHLGQRPAVPVLRVHRESGAAEPLGPLYAPHELGTPNYGGWPSWIGNDTILIGEGSAEQCTTGSGCRRRRRGSTDSRLRLAGLQTLIDAEVAPTGDRLAVVRGNHQETIAFLKLNGPPPAGPTVANFNATAPVANPTGKFVDPTWSSDGQLLAWQEGDGVWTGAIPADLANCSAFRPVALRHPRRQRARPQPRGDQSRAPGRRAATPATRHLPAEVLRSPGAPPCRTLREPGDPRCVPCRLRSRLRCASASRDCSRRVEELRSLGIRGLAAQGPPRGRVHGPGRRHAHRAAHGQRRLRPPCHGARRRAANYAAAGKAKLTIKLSRQGRKRLRRARRLTATLKASFTPTGAPAISTKTPIQVKR